MLRIFLLVLICFCLLGCGDKEPTIPKASRPELNPKPKYYLNVDGIVKGHEKNKLRFVALYQTHNEACETTDNWLEGGKAPQVFTENYDVDLAKSNFKFRVPVDKFMPGKCAWRISWVLLFDKNLDNSSVIFAYGDEEYGLMEHIVISRKNHGWDILEPNRMLPHYLLGKNYHVNLTILNQRNKL